MVFEYVDLDGWTEFGDVVGDCGEEMRFEHCLMGCIREVFEEDADCVGGKEEMEEEKVKVMRIVRHRLFRRGGLFVCSGGS